MCCYEFTDTTCIHEKLQKQMLAINMIAATCQILTLLDCKSRTVLVIEYNILYDDIIRGVINVDTT